MAASYTPLLVAFVGLVSAILGGVIQSVAARSSEASRFERQSKWELYSSYFTVLGELTFADEGSERRLSALSFMAQLRGRIGVVGSAEVVRAVGQVFRFSDLKSDEAQSAMATALNAMRHDVRARDSRLMDRDMIQLMFGNREVTE